MAKVVMFPQKKKLPASIEQRLSEISKEYVEALQTLIVLMDIDLTDDKQFNEVTDLVHESFTRGILDAINALD